MDSLFLFSCSMYTFYIKLKFDLSLEHAAAAAATAAVIMNNQQQPYIIITRR